MSSSIQLAHLRTQLAVSAPLEQERQNELDSSTPPDYFRRKGRHLHFQWNTESVRLRNIDPHHPEVVAHNLPSSRPGHLPDVIVGEGQISMEGVVYSQLYDPDPAWLAFKIHGNQFTNIGEPMYSSDVPEFTFRLRDSTRYDEPIPDGALIKLIINEGRSEGQMTRDSNGNITHVIENRGHGLAELVTDDDWNSDWDPYVGCDYNPRFGKPTIPKLEKPKRGLSKFVHSIKGSVKDKARGFGDLGRKLTGRKKKD